MTLSHRFHHLSIGLAALVIAGATPAFANHLTTASVIGNSTSYTITVSGTDLNATDVYMVLYTINLISAGPAITITRTIPVTRDSVPSGYDAITGNPLYSFTATETQPWGPLTQAYTLAGTASLFSFEYLNSTIPIDFNRIPTTLSCFVGTVCPATPGFWKNQKQHPFPNSIQASGLTIAGVTYSASSLYTILSNNGGNAVAILGRHLVAARLNLAAGAVHNPMADAAIATAESLLQANNLNLVTSSVDPSTSLGQALLAPATVLDTYNNANFHTCSEAAGLVLGN